MEEHLRQMRTAFAFTRSVSLLVVGGLFGLALATALLPGEEHSVAGICFILCALAGWKTWQAWPMLNVPVPLSLVYHSTWMEWRVHSISFIEVRGSRAFCWTRADREVEVCLYIGGASDGVFRVRRRIEGTRPDGTHVGNPEWDHESRNVRDVEVLLGQYEQWVSTPPSVAG